MKQYPGSSIQANGIKIHYYRSTPPGGGPTLVFLHGLTDNGMCWVRVADALSGTYDLVMPETRGHGFSEKPAEGYSIVERAADVAGLIDALALDHPILIGHSLGGQAATATAGLYPDKVGAVILEDPAWFEDKEPEEGAADEAGSENTRGWLRNLQHQKSLERAALIAECRQENPGWHQDELSVWADAKHQMDENALVKILTSKNGSWKQFVRSITCPILLVTPEPGRGIISPEMVREAEGLWKQGQEAHIPGAGHSIHRDQFEPYMEKIQLFLRQRG
jgi:N-formylmaleamate deformylase